ncbi:chitin deacetylase [Microbotryomycetes sp. JL221]|nr:chitin deacetylase [Microbotryomycetes sp. JL221]
MRAFSVAALALPAIVAAVCSDHKPEPAHPELVRRLERRQRGESSSAASTRTSSAAASGATAAPGAVNPFVEGAPPLPDWQQLDLSEFPELDRIPPINSPKVQQWIREVGDRLPNIPLTGLNGCSNSTFNAQALKDAGADANCWWTCGGCTRDSDVTVCPADKRAFGMSFDDGPSDDTPRLLDYLDSEDLKSTFFVVGSRVLSRPETLQDLYMRGMSVSLHTWSHPSLTTLSNEEIIAELGWSKEVIKAVIGVTPTTMRPPYGDIDDRVRAICEAMDLKPIIWTSVGDVNFDTDDWRMSDTANPYTQEQILENFDNFLSLSEQLTTGFIVLAHDLYTRSVDFAIQTMIPRAMRYTPKLDLMPIVTCQGLDYTEDYVETRTGSNSTSSASSSAADGEESSTRAASRSSTASRSGTSSTTGAGPSQSGSRTASSGNQEVSPTNRPSSSGTKMTLGAGVAVGILSSILLL